MRDFFEAIDGIVRGLQSVVEFLDVLSWGGSKKHNKRNALKSNGPQPNTRVGCFFRSLGCLLVLAVIVLIVLYLIGTFFPPTKPTVPQPTPVPSATTTRPSPTTPSSIKDIKIPTLPK